MKWLQAGQKQQKHQQKCIGLVPPRNTFTDPPLSQKSQNVPKLVAISGLKNWPKIHEGGQIHSQKIFLMRN